ncbi:IS110 family transposase [Sphingobium fuliginis]|uniref:IS110 family transposase n=2 Tax=Sphingobium fuliginis (strain ATCC 27551) TaxID=336203 RepID=A0ABQ1F5Y6_SPHSA|nr:IS110 family transposase [Sphingobium fuliginis]
MAGHQAEADKIAQRIGKGQDLGRHAPFGTTNGLALSPPLWMARPLPKLGAVRCDLADLEGRMMRIAMLGVDLGKNSCSLVGLDEAGKVVLRRRMRRETVIAFAGKLPTCVVAMEACCGAHHMGRILAGQGHEVRLMSPEYVRPYVKAQKNDDRDAEAIAEAATRPTMRFVTLKSEEQLDMQTLHRVRDRLVAERTSLMNQIRSLLLERGHVVPQGRARLAAALVDLLDGLEPRLSTRMAMLVGDMRDRWRSLDERIATFDREFAQAAEQDGQARRLLTIPGIGALNATALVAAVGDAGTFARGRDLAAWLGLVPRQATTGGKPKLLGITKRGSRYLRKLLIQGARSAMPTLRKTDTRLGAWLRGLLARAHPNTAVVALAAKLARIVWALLRHERTYHMPALSA